MDTMEDRLRSLAARGFRIGLNISPELYGPNKGEVMFRVDLSTGDAHLGGAGMRASGVGPSLDLATRSALRGAEAFLQDPEPPEAVLGALVDLAAPVVPAERNAEHAASPAGRMAAEIEGRAATDVRRAAALATGIPQAGDRVRAAEDAGALS